MVSNSRPKSYPSASGVSHRKKEAAPLPPVNSDYPQEKEAEHIKNIETDSSESSSRVLHSSSEKPTECPFKHEHGDTYKEVSSVVVSLSPKEVFDVIFDPQSEMIKEIYKEKNYVDVNISPWTRESEDDDSIRKLTCTANLPSKVFGPSSSQVEQTFHLSKMNQENEIYVGHSTIANSGIPYGDNFRIYTHTCIVRESPEERNGTEVPRTRLSFYYYVKFRKTTFFLVRGIIEKQACEGMQDYAASVASGLTNIAENLRPSAQNKVKLQSNNQRIEPTPKTNNGSSNSSTILFNSYAVWATVIILVAIATMNAVIVINIVNGNKQMGTKSDLLTLSALRYQLNSTLDSEDFEDIIEMKKLLRQYFLKLRKQIEQSLQTINKAENDLESILLSLPAYEKEFVDIFRYQISKSKEVKETQTN